MLSIVKRFYPDCNIAFSLILDTVLDLFHLDVSIILLVHILLIIKISASCIHFQACQEVICLSSMSHKTRLRLCLTSTEIQGLLEVDLKFIKEKSHTIFSPIINFHLFFHHKKLVRLPH